MQTIQTTHQFTWNGLVFNTGEPIGKGDYSNVYQFEHERRSYVLKVFQFEKINAKSNNKVRDMLSTQIDNYRRAIANNIPCARLINVDTALNDGFTIYEYIPDPLITNWIELANDATQRNYRTQIRTLIQSVVNANPNGQNNLNIDLKTANLRVRDGQILLIDHFEEQDLEDWLIFLSKGALELAKGNEGVLSDICPTIVKQHIDYMRMKSSSSF